MKKKVAEKVTEAQYKKALKDYAAAEANLATEQAAMDKAVQDASKPFVPKMEKLNDKKTAAYDTVFNYAEQNREALFVGDAKSLETPHGTISYRLGQRKVAFTEEWNAKKVLAVLQKARWNGADSFIVEKPELDKAAVLKCKDEVQLGYLRKTGVAIEQTETFSIKKT